MADSAIRNACPKDADKLLALIDIASGGFVFNLFGKLAPTGMSAADFIVSRMESPESGLSYSKLWVSEIDARLRALSRWSKRQKNPNRLIRTRRICSDRLPN